MSTLITCSSCHEDECRDVGHGMCGICDPVAIWVECDEGCGALLNPVTVEELRAAVIHWRHHGYLNGCSHGC